LGLLRRGGEVMARPAEASQASSRSIRSTGALVRYLTGRGILHAVAVIVGVLLMIPYAWAAISSLKPASEVRRIPPQFFPTEWMFTNYSDVWMTRLFPFWVQNTIVITVLATIGTVATAALAGYAFARFRFPFKGPMFAVTLSTMLLPDAVTLIPRFLLFFQLGWLDTFLPLIVPFWLGGSAFFIFLFRQFFMTIPIDLDEAAKIDGASYLDVLLKIILPLSLPVLATVGIIAFIAHYDSFIFPLIILNDPTKFTLSIGLRYFNISPSADAIPTDHLLLAMSIMMTLPIIIIFFFGQRYFVRGVVMSGIKG
jgi:multiple sugar transport system permease protein